ncbi:cbb3-type cytochrome oxidase subunit 3 [Massilia sp. DWR3-1-1]|jgi:cytochrome c oxidase cbb3-type subunit 4|uniref:cbb3-type cytochrome oxidase subunit 3 n=1 Tax=Massilia sp. DWR3-1-1 TaxID=2804559 RepID=UPI003CE67249
MLIQLFDHASSIMTVLSFITFIGILAWTFVLRRADDFNTAAALPFADEDREERNV